jgi:hypothetical protein
MLMIKVLEGLFGRSSREQPVKKPMPAASPWQACTAGDFRAVSIAPNIMSCNAAMHSTGKIYLLRDAPRLPLDACTRPADCSCKFRKKLDRRDGDRRLFGATETNRWFAGTDNRKHRSRRSSDGDSRRSPG